MAPAIARLRLAHDRGHSSLLAQKTRAETVKARLALPRNFRVAFRTFVGI
jgi:hypothetical protein